MKIKKKPVVLDAWVIDTLELQYDGDLPLWVHEAWCDERLVVKPSNMLSILTLEGMMTASDGDVLVIGVRGELYAIKWEIFRDTYDVVEEDMHGVGIHPTQRSTIEVVSINEHADGSADVMLDMDPESLKIFAKKGIYQALVEAAQRVVDDHPADPVS